MSTIRSFVINAGEEEGEVSSIATIPERREHLASALVRALDGSGQPPTEDESDDDVIRRIADAFGGQWRMEKAAAAYITDRAITRVAETLEDLISKKISADSLVNAAFLYARVGDAWSHWTEDEFESLRTLAGERAGSPATEEHGALLALVESSVAALALASECTICDWSAAFSPDAIRGEANLVRGFELGLVRIAVMAAELGAHRSALDPNCRGEHWIILVDRLASSGFPCVEWAAVSVFEEIAADVACDLLDDGHAVCSQLASAAERVQRRMVDSAYEPSDLLCGRLSYGLELAEPMEATTLAAIWMQTTLRGSRPDGPRLDAFLEGAIGASGSNGGDALVLELLARAAWSSGSRMDRRCLSDLRQQSRHARSRATAPGLD